MVNEQLVLLKDVDDIFQEQYDKMKKKLLKNAVSTQTYKTRVFFYESIYNKLEKIKAKVHRKATVL